MLEKNTDLGCAISELVSWLRTQNYSFVTTTPATHARVVGRRHGEASQSLRDAFGWSLPFQSDLLPDALLAKLQRAGLICRVGNCWQSGIRVSTLGSYLLAHSAYPTSAEDAVFFGPDTYRFASVLKRFEGLDGIRTAVDIGCGTGAAGLLLASWFPHVRVVLADINPQALSIAASNAQANGLNNVKVGRSDVFSHLPGPFDLIVGNPPYMVDQQQRAYRHGGKNGTELSLRILKASLDRLSERGVGLLYTGTPIMNGQDEFRRDAESILKSAGVVWTYEELDPDVFGEELEMPAYRHVERIAVVALTFRRR